MVLTQRKTNRSTEQNKEPINRPTHVHFQQGVKGNSVEKGKPFKEVVLERQDIYVLKKKKRRGRLQFIPCSILKKKKSQLKVDHRP